MVKLTQGAIDEISKIFETQNMPETSCFRVEVSIKDGTLQHKISIADRPYSDDLVVKDPSGLIIAYDFTNLIIGTVIDYVDEPGKGFIFDKSTRIFSTPMERYEIPFKDIEEIRKREAEKETEQ
jgi:Fe-S cluster assembly iron-binding protein IscA